ncbi:MAG: hypothetical protein JWO20_3141 [Candidatus Angelobacter sp.]|jgi:hypothetical protein|nr:hypothetical protein [Candidatus Angelobacter sp.]
MKKQKGSYRDLQWPIRPRRKFGWPVHAGAIALGASGAAADIWFGQNGWSISVVLGVGVIGCAILVMRRFWHRLAFWMTLVAMSAFQVPLTILAHRMVSQLTYLSMFAFSIVDFFVVALVVNWVCPDQEDHQNA